MDAGSLLGDEQFLADLPAGPTGREQREDLGLTSGQAAEAAGCRLVGPLAGVDLLVKQSLPRLARSLISRRSGRSPSLTAVRCAARSTGSIRACDALTASSASAWSPLGVHDPIWQLESHPAPHRCRPQLGLDRPSSRDSSASASAA